MLFSFIFSILINLSSAYYPQVEGIHVIVNGVNNQAGEIMVALFDSQEGFPLNAHRAFKLAKCPAQDGTVFLTIEKVPPGKYAIALFHDTNGDAILNTNVLGIPKEGYGVSNNIKNKFSAPSFQQAQFIHQDSTSLTISIHY